MEGGPILPAIPCASRRLTRASHLPLGCRLLGQGLGLVSPLFISPQLSVPNPAMAEKDLYSVGVGGQESPTHDQHDHHDIKDVVNSKGVAVGEAADIYGDLQTAEELGYVHRG